jgi:GMP synthase (glutamine-hydrolysing)
MRACVFVNEEESGLGLFDEFFRTSGIDVDFLSRHEPSQWRIREDIDFFLHLGSSWSTYWDTVRELVEAETRVIRYATERGVPVLGICFGAQLISQTFGGVVQRGLRPEIGWHRVASPHETSLFAGRWMQWHYDSFTAPRGFEVLATSEAGVQGIRRGRLLGVQFHPEADESVVANWVEGGGAAELDTLGISPSELIDETRREVPRSKVAARAIFEWFLDDVSQCPAEPLSSN